MSEEAYALRGSRGMLRGIRHRPDGADAGRTVLVLQGYYSSTHVGPARLYVQMARRLAAVGCEVLRVDCWGVGDADGDLATATYEGHLEDYRLVLESVRAQTPHRRIVLLGHSMGTSLAIRLAAQARPVEHLLLVSPSCGRYPDPLAHLNAAQWADLTARGEAERKAVRVQRAFIEAIQREDVYALARGLKAPALLFRGTRDEFYDAENVRRLLDALPDARLVEIPGADHNYLAPGTRAAFLAAFEREVCGEVAGPGR